MSGDRVLMGTGHRKIHNSGAVRSALVSLVAALEPDAVRSGGAPGFDTLLAEAALALGVPLLLDLPNQLYRAKYADAVSDEIVEQAAEVRYIVDRPMLYDWPRLWYSERWWLDNHTRNHAMVDDSTDAVVGSETHPLALAAQSGGTAECVRYIVRNSDLPGAFWIPTSDPAPEHQWVPIARQLALAEPAAS